MGKATCAAVLPLLIVVLSGCRLCPDCDLDSYGAYGGRWQRTDRDNGIVGSIFVPAGAMVPYESEPRGVAEDVSDESTEDGSFDPEELDPEVLESEMFDSLDEDPAEQDESVLE